MKKIIKSFKQALLLQEEVSNNQHEMKPQGVSNSNSEKGKETAISVSIAANQRQNNLESVKPKGSLATIQSEEAVQADKIECSSQRQLHHNGCRLFLGGLPDNITEAEVRKAFENYGKVVDIVIPSDKDTNKPKRYGYLEFRNEDSAKACLDDHFLTIGGKRVEIKKAWPRNSTKKEKNCGKKETNEMGNYEKFMSCTKGLEGSSESLLCSGIESNMENTQLSYQKLFKDYFKAKFFLQNMLSPETAFNMILSEEINKQQKNEEKTEKILRGLYVTTKEDNSEEDSGDFSGDTDYTHSTFDELEYYSFRDLDGGSTPSGQTENIPLLVKEAEKGVCNLCKWASLDDSSEDFLAHCKTFAHKQKLKERFKKCATPDNPPNKTLTHADSSSGNRKNEQNRKKRPKNLQKKPPSKTQNNKKKGNSVLEEIMSSIEAKTEKCIKCKMCNKTIPQAGDIRSLMANLSHHLQSKGHLARISEFEKRRGSRKMC